MDWKAFLTTFVAVFLAELGDKTQIATLSFAAGFNSFLSVFLGSALALILTSLLAALIGSSLAHIIPERWVHLGAGGIFVVLGVILVIRNLR
ncbi:MAG: TMEM165/GDT1 family protein [candidate division WOR-3 bacterium]|jgi:putative Ca2+/H+ antiporter (TMEM165/GDT1 family)|nr:TMEM165/GDT1 family protein [candidate division WOR-3 bacterium]MCR4423063.1 TMEM165/GDT1 family protein [candidate division WOR-3 bacterium]MDH7518402.1 TMEM165/GDT1 family protein [bacterium]